MASAAYASVINDVLLTGGGGTNWDPDADTYACTDPSLTPDGFTPISDGTTDSPSRSDAFDDAFVVWVGDLSSGRIFRDLDGNGHKSGQSLKVGPTPTGGLVVTQTERALQTSPTLRMLYSFKNKSDHARSRVITLESNLGSDSTTTIARSSSGDATWGDSDRWLVTHDAPFGVGSDPVVTQVWFGKGAAERVVNTNNTDGSADCFASKFRIRVPANSSRSLMFFAEMNADSIADAKQKARKFNDRNLSGNLLDGLSQKAQNKILNWDL